MICFFVLRRFALRDHSFVEYLRALSIFDLLSLLIECFQSLNELTVYLFGRDLLLLLRSSFFCKCSECLSHTFILLSCWTIVGLTFDRLILVCDPCSLRCPNLSRRICNRRSAKKLIFLLTFFALLINLPHSWYQEWICRRVGHQNSAAFHPRIDSIGDNDGKKKNLSDIWRCQCRLSPHIDRQTLDWIIKWKIYIFHLLCYTSIPALILLASNAGTSICGLVINEEKRFPLAILRRLHEPRQIVGQQNEHLRSRLTRTLTMVSVMFLILYFPHAIVQTLSIVVLPHYQSSCDVHSLIRIRILKRLCELLNIAALGINFFLYILGVNHYRSATIQMLGLHHFKCCLPYLTIEHRNSLGSNVFQLNSQYQQRRTTQIDLSTAKFIKNHFNTDREQV